MENSSWIRDKATGPPDEPYEKRRSLTTWWAWDAICHERKEVIAGASVCVWGGSREGQDGARCVRLVCASVLRPAEQQAACWLHSEERRGARRGNANPAPQAFLPACDSAAPTCSSVCLQPRTWPEPGFKPFQPPPQLPGELGLHPPSRASQSP